MSAEVNIVGVRFSPTGRTIECDAGNLSLRKGTEVVVEDDQGADIAVVSVPSSRRAPRGPLPRVLRVSDARDRDRRTAALGRAAEARAVGRECAQARHLSIKVFHAEAALGGGRVTIYFASEQRIDFRDLVRDIGARLRARVEMRQVGVRDEAKMVGGIGSCGLELCCTTFLPHFAPISIKMAKHQNIVLNPTKVSGQCGRLKCCLVYEDAAYVEAGKKLPKTGKRVETPLGIGRVGDLDVLAGKVRVYFEDQPPHVFPAEEVRSLAAPQPGAHEPEDPEGSPPGVPPG